MKNVLITCATSNMGSEISKAISPKTNLFITGRDEKKLSELHKSLLVNRQGCVTTAKLDFFSSDSIDKCAELATNGDGFDGVVFIIPRIPASSEVFPDDEVWRELYEKYFILPLRLIRKLVEKSAINSGCKIVFISGLSSKTALTNYSLNNCLRSAWLGQAKTMALSLASNKVSVNTISLGGVMTESYTNKMHAKAKANNLSFEKLMEDEVSNIPLQKYASVDDVTSAILALMGPLSNHMTGQNILLDGGFNRSY